MPRSSSVPPALDYGGLSEWQFKSRPSASISLLTPSSPVGLPERRRSSDGDVKVFNPEPHVHYQRHYESPPRSPIRMDSTHPYELPFLPPPTSAEYRDYLTPPPESPNTYTRDSYGFPRLDLPTPARSHSVPSSFTLPTHLVSSWSRYDPPPYPPPGIEASFECRPDLLHEFRTYRFPDLSLHALSSLATSHASSVSSDYSSPCIDYLPGPFSAPARLSVPPVTPEGEPSQAPRPARVMPYRSGVTPFVSKLYWILEHEIEFGDCARWSADGNVCLFAIGHPRFISEVLPDLFLHGNITSFLRQLHIYGFHRLSTSSQQLAQGISTPSLAKSEDDRDWRAFEHSLMKRGEVSGLSLLKPRPSKARGIKKAKAKASQNRRGVPRSPDREEVDDEEGE